MGAGQSKEEALYQAAANSNHQAVKSLRRDGASLEWVDKEGRTPLILACTRGDLYDMVVTLLNEGANPNAYKSGPHGGYPLHHAAKRGLDKTVILLLSRGADPLAVNDDRLTPLDMARSRSHTSVVRIIEDRICLFSGVVRELSGLGFLEVIAPHLVTKKIWVVVVPAPRELGKPSRKELVIYPNAKVPMPRMVISLARVEMEEPKFNQHDPILVITTTEKNTKTKFKFLSENEGDKAQLERLYKACALGIRQIESASPMPQAAPLAQVALQGLQALMFPQTAKSSTPVIPTPPPAPPIQSISPVRGTFNGEGKPSKLPPSRENQVIDDVDLAMAIEASIVSASAEGIPVSPSVQMSPSCDGAHSKWGPPDKNKVDRAQHGGWVDGEQQSNYGGWGSGSSGGAGPSRLGASVGDSPSTSESKSPATNHPLPPLRAPPSPASSGLPSSSSQSLPVTASPSTTTAPSAPPLPLDGPILYPSIDTSPVKVDYTTPALENVPGGANPSGDQKADEKSTAGQCVVCWDAPAEAICIPCGHLAGCMDCLTEIKSKDWGCPVCRATIQQVVKVYAV